ncbi:nocturnin [Thecamonas trahens ATCC 50062]|uniref:Nocturnin n=1 Tax=Thecamonas trahens ATCC 50062 TaxID=461836 RepID=A0A0L0D9Q7_THETB|nr:nocturnin [Thecamonas trahens ATCC 50062]KNC49077.1 nocturnin [Thecamonas trahens ATCC 50062]|eukprot:XP_013758108.1 nocturnin [Thecamonas trahens ATCC 50062]
MAATKDVHAQREALLAQAAAALDGRPGLYKRGWAMAGVDDAAEEATGVRIMQFNVLADGLSGLQEERGGFYAAPEGSLQFETRKWRLLEEVLLADPDVLAMQEVDHFADWFEPMLAKVGYEGVFLKKANSPCLQFCDLEDGVALFVRSSKLRLAAVEQISFPDANQVALLARAELPESGRALTLAVTHLKATKSAEGENIREGQAVHLLAKAKAFMQAGAGDAPLVVCADLNAAPHDAKYPAKAWRAMMAADLELASAYGGRSADSEPAYTTWKLRPGKEAKHTIDYIFYQPAALTVSSTLAIPAEDVVVDVRLPSWEYPSDHFALAADFIFAPSSMAADV